MVYHQNQMSDRFKYIINDIFWWNYGHIFLIKLNELIFKEKTHTADGVELEASFFLDFILNLI